MLGLPGHLGEESAFVHWWGEGDVSSREGRS